MMNLPCFGLQAHGGLLQIHALLVCLAENGMHAPLQFSALCKEVVEAGIHTRCPLLASECILIGKLLISVSSPGHAEQDVANLRAVCTAVLHELAEEPPTLHLTVMQPVLINSAVTGLLCAVAAQHTEDCKTLHDRAGPPDADVFQLISSRNIEVRRAAWRALLAMLASGECILYSTNIAPVSFWLNLWVLS